MRRPVTPPPIVRRPAARSIWPRSCQLGPCRGRGRRDRGWEPGVRSRESGDRRQETIAAKAPIFNPPSENRTLKTENLSPPENRKPKVEIESTLPPLRIEL